jgi:hypothetical protein
MQVSMEVLLTELGLLLQPLQQSFVTYGKWVTNTWLKSIWEKVDKSEDQYLAEVNLDNLESSSGQRQEYWLVAICAVREACTLRGNSHSHGCCNRSTQDGRVIT